MESTPLVAAQVLDTVHFKTNTQIAFPGIAPEGRLKMHTLIDALGVSKLQRIEAASYSMAMVVRFALGQSATDGRVTALVGDSLAGLVALATLRHLVNAGAVGTVLSVVETTQTSEEYTKLLKPLDAMGVTIIPCADISSVHSPIESSHNVMVGLYEAIETHPLRQSLVAFLNEVQTPMHSIECPIGVDPLTGVGTDPLFASSTLSLGAPLIGLSAGSEYVGRHYLCDISASAQIYRESGAANLTSLFSDQPVLQISPFVPPAAS